MQQVKEKDGGDGVFKNGGTCCSEQKRIGEMPGAFESLRNPFYDPPGRSSSLTRLAE